MSGPVIAGSAATGIAVATAGVILVIRLRGTPDAQARLAEGAARSADLELTPDLVYWVAARVRRRMAATAVAGLLLVGVAFYWTAYHTAAVFQTLSSRNEPLFGLSGVVVLFSAGLVAEAGGHAWEASRTRTAGVPAQPGNRAAARSEAIPPAVTWAVRAMVLLPAAATIVVAGSVRHPYQVAWWACGLGIALSLLAAGAAERLQRHFLRGPRLGASPGQLAFDQAFRASAALDVAALPVGVASLAAGLICTSALNATIGSRTTGSGPLFAMFLIAGLAGFVPLLLAQLRWSQRYFRRHPDDLAVPDRPASPPSPA